MVVESFALLLLLKSIRSLSKPSHLKTRTLIRLQTFFSEKATIPKTANAHTTSHNPPQYAANPEPKTQPPTPTSRKSCASKHNPNNN